MKAAFALALVVLLTSCGVQKPASEMKASRDAVIFLMTDGVGVSGTGVIEGDRNDPVAMSFGDDELIRAVQECTSSFSVERPFHHTLVIVKADAEVPDPAKLVGCVKSRMSGKFSAGMGSSTNPFDFDQSEFDKFHAKTH